MDDSQLSAEKIGQFHSRALFETLSDLSVISSFGAGAILYDPRFDRDRSLSENLKAVSVAASLGKTSVDRMRREFGDRELSAHNTDPARARYVAAYKRAKSYVEESLGSLRTDASLPLTLGMYAGAVALQRLQWSMFAAHLLYQLRLTFEADSVARHVLEQIAWTIAVADLDDHEDIQRVQPQKTIGGLRALVPAAGPLYGALSETTHAGIASHRAVFDVNENERGVIHHGLTDWSASASVILNLADLWVVAHEHSQRGHVRSIVASDPADGYRPIVDRPFLREASALSAAIQAAEADGA